MPELLNLGSVCWPSRCSFCGIIYMKRTKEGVGFCFFLAFGDQMKQHCPSNNGPTVLYQESKASIKLVQTPPLGLLIYLLFFSTYKYFVWSNMNKKLQTRVMWKAFMNALKSTTQPNRCFVSTPPSPPRGFSKKLQPLLWPPQVQQTYHWGVQVLQRGLLPNPAKTKSPNPSVKQEVRGRHRARGSVDLGPLTGVQQ